MPVNMSIFLLALILPELAWSQTAAPESEVRIAVLYVNTPT